MSASVLNRLGGTILGILLIVSLVSALTPTAEAESSSDTGSNRNLYEEIVVVDEGGTPLADELLVIEHDLAVPAISVRSTSALSGTYRVLANRVFMDASVPDVAVADHPFSLVSVDGGERYTVDVTLAGDPLDVTFARFQPQTEKALYSFGSSANILLERPMFIRLTSLPHYENETRVGANQNGTFAYEVEHFVLELGIAFDDADTSGQPVLLSSGWLSGFGFTKPAFRHEDGTPIRNSSMGTHWLLEPAHFSTIWVFSVDSEGFSKETDYPYSDIYWDSGNRRIHVHSDRRDPNWANEMFRVDKPFVWNPTTSFTIRGSWKTTQQGNWQQAIPLFFTASANGNLNSPNTIRVYYISRDSNLGQAPLYRLQFIDSTGTTNTLGTHYGVANTQYFFGFKYDAYTQVLTLTMSDVMGNVLASSSMTVDTGAFSLSKVGAATKGEALSWEPPTIGWTDSIHFDVSYAKNGDMELDVNTDGLPDGWVANTGTQHFTFDTSDEGFAKETDYPYSDVHWDSTNGRVYVKSDRRDAGDEMFTRSTATLDTSTDFTVTARWRTTQQGNWQQAYPIFLAGASNTQVDAADSVYIWYYSRDSNLNEDPRYVLRYRDASGTLRLSVWYTGQVDTEYHFYIDYDASTQMLALEVRDVNDATLKSASYTIGTNSNDGFTFGKVGVSSRGLSSTWEPATYAWTDDIVLSTESSSVSASRSSARAHTNTYSVRMADSSSSQSLTLETAADDRAEGKPGAFFKASAWVYVDGGTHHLYLQFRDGSGDLLKSEHVSTRFQDIWEYLEVTTMAPDNTATVSVKLLSGETNTGTAYWDSVELEMLDEFWSINNHDGDAGQGLDGWRKTFDYALDLGVTHVRTDFRWDDFHTGDDSWDTWELAYWQDVMYMGRARGIDLIVILNGPKPAWVPDGDKHWRFGEFCEKMAETFGDEVYYYQILNEFNHPLGHDTSIEGDFPTFINLCNSGLYRGEGVSKANSKSEYKTIINAFASDSTLDWATDMESWVSEAESHIDVVAIDYYPETWSLASCDNWSPMDELANIMSTYSKEGAIMETGLAGANQGDWINCALVAIRDKVRSHDESYPKLPFLLGNWYELVNDPNADPPLDNFGLLWADLTPKNGYDDFRTQVASYEF